MTVMSQIAAQHGLGDSTMLERIDALFSCGVGEHVNIPQIVVVGDQSSGKSSVLSGLIRKDLPRDSGLCTRFATKIVFRRAQTSSVRASIIPDESATVDHRAEVAAWGELIVDSFDDFIFADVMKEVHQVIGVASPHETPNAKPTFSGDVLQLEISGPHEEHLSVIDVPGIFRDPTPGLTTKDDIEMVRNMVLRYMKNPRSVMPTVVPANVDIATQEILRLANEMDPEGDRTLGVLTKPDLVDRGAEHRVIDLIEGRTRPIKLGWHVLRNPGQSDLADCSFDRQTQEINFFQTEQPWNNLDATAVGIEALRSRLKEVLSGLVRREFADVRAEVQKKLDAAENKLKGLGPQRDSRAAQATYLAEISTRFQHLVDSALSAKYGTDCLFDEHEILKIAPAVVLRMEQFGREMTEFGHKYPFDPPEQQHCAAVQTNYGGKKSKQKALVEVSPIWKTYTKEKLCVRKHVDSNDLADLLYDPETLSLSRGEQTDQWIQQLHSHNRGFELGTFDPVILSAAMKEQTRDWRPISFGFVSDVIAIIHSFTKTALACLCPSERLQADLYSMLFEDLKVRYEKAVKQVEFILAVELDGTPMTQNQYFIDRLEESRQARFVANLDDLAIQDEFHGAIVKINELKMRHPMGHDRYLIRDIHDILQSYYEVARKRVTDNICKQAADHFLITGPDTPLRVFSPVFVSRMTDEQLEQIAKEEPRVQRQRAKLVKDIENLRRARQVLV